MKEIFFTPVLHLSSELWEHLFYDTYVTLCILFWIALYTCILHMHFIKYNVIECSSLYKIHHCALTRKKLDQYRDTLLNCGPRSTPVNRSHALIFYEITPTALFIFSVSFGLYCNYLIGRVNFHWYLLWQNVSLFLLLLCILIH